MSTTHEEVVAEERAARARVRALERAQAAAAKSRETDWRRRLREALESIDTRGCSCGLHPRMTRAQLRALGSGCTRERWVCPVLDTVRRRMGV